MGISDDISSLAKKTRAGFIQCNKLEGCDGCPYIPEEKAGNDCVGIMHDDILRFLEIFTEGQPVLRWGR